jgi:hypothetical protein
VTESGVAQALKVRAALAGVDAERVHPHVLRHSFADRWKRSGGSEEDLMPAGPSIKAGVIEHTGERICLAGDVGHATRLADDCTVLKRWPGEDVAESPPVAIGTPSLGTPSLIVLFQATCGECQRGQDGGQ